MMMDDESKTEINAQRKFSKAIFALESGRFEESERLLKDTINMLGKTHHVSMLAMKTLVGITSERGRSEEALQISLDLFEAQIAALGVTHSETARTVKNMVDLCKELGKPDVAEHIATMVQIASEEEKLRSTNSFRNLRLGVGGVEEVESKPNLWDRIVHYFYSRFERYFKWLAKSGNATMGITLIGGLAGLIAISYIVLFLIGTTSTKKSNVLLRKACAQYSTIDKRKRLEFVSDYQVVVALDLKTLAAPFRVYGRDWHDVGTLSTSSIFDKENWLLCTPEGLKECHAKPNVFYRYDAPERVVFQQMQEIMLTADEFFRDRGYYPEQMKQISKTSFRYMNPFTKEMEEPSLQIINLKALTRSNYESILDSLQLGGRWPGEPNLRAGCIHCCQITGGKKPAFLIHGCDRNNRSLSGTDGLAVLLRSEDGRLVKTESDSSPLVSMRTPIYCVMDFPSELTTSITPFLRYRFSFIFGWLLIAFALLSRFVSKPKEKAVALILIGLCLILTLASVASALMP